MIDDATLGRILLEGYGKSNMRDILHFTRSARLIIIELIKAAARSRAE